VLAAVNGWAKAWSAKDADAYLAYYASAFQVPGGEPRAAGKPPARSHHQAGSIESHGGVAESVLRCEWPAIVSVSVCARGFSVSDL